MANSHYRYLWLAIFLTDGSFNRFFMHIKYA